jgi:hypothetical protein
MSEKDGANFEADEPVAAKRVLPPAARRALAEAEERRRKADEELARNPRPREINGSKAAAAGIEPTRYGDWEIKGILSDF